MANIVDLDLKLNEQYLAASVQDIVKAAIVSALGDPTKVLSNAVDSVMGSYVDSDGKPCNSSSYRARPYLDWLAQETIKETVKQVIREVIDEHKEEFKEIIKQQISSKRMKNNIALAFLDTIVDCAKSTYKMPIEVKFNEAN